MDIKFLTCPLCGGGKLVLQRESRDDGFFERNNLNLYKRAFEIVRCSTCDFVFVKNPFDPSHYKKGEAMDIPKLEAPPSPKPRHSFLLAMLQSVIKKVNKAKPRILEIGCGFGQLYRLAHTAGYDYTAIEPSPIRAKTLADSGLNVFSGTVQEFCRERSSELFDVIVIDNVIEHIPHPGQSLAELSLLMSPECFMIVAAPNLNDIRRYIIPGWGNRQWMPAGHANYFTPHTLGYLLGNYDFEIIYPIFITPGLGLLKGVGCLAKLLLEKYLRIYPFGLYICSQKISSSQPIE